MQETTKSTTLKRAEAVAGILYDNIFVIEVNVFGKLVDYGNDLDIHMVATVENEMARRFVRRVSTFHLRHGLEFSAEFRQIVACQIIHLTPTALAQALGASNNLRFYPTGRELSLFLLFENWSDRIRQLNTQLRLEDTIKLTRPIKLYSPSQRKFL